MELSKTFLCSIALAFALVCSAFAQSEDGIISCSWSKNLCHWHHPEEHDFAWQRTRQAQSFGKEVHASPTSFDDRFLWATGGDSHALSHDKLVVLKSAEFYNPTPGILSFFHLSQSASAPGIYVNVTLNGVTKTVKKFQGFQHFWKQRTIEVGGPGVVSIVIAAAPVGHGIDEMEYSRDGSIALFREYIKPYPRPVVTDGQVSCSFRHSMCGWSQYPGLPGHWQRTQSAVGFPNGFVNGSSNHWEDAWFLSVNEQENYGEESDAAIITHTFTQTTPSWLSFWWAKYEPENAASAVFVKVITDRGTESVYYSKLPVNFWVNQNISIPYTGRIRLLIAFRLTTPTSQGVLDEIEFSGDLHHAETTTMEPGSIDDSKEFLF